MGHSERKVVFDRTQGAFQAAGAAVPALHGIANDGFLFSVWPRNDIPRTYLIAVPTLFAFLVDDGWHGLSPLAKSLPAFLGQEEEIYAAT